MRRTNSKEAMEAIKNAIMESYEAAEGYYTYDNKEAKTDYNDICKDILTAFENEKVKYDCQYRAGRISKYSLFCDWMAGLTTAFPISDDIFLGSAVDWLADILDETEEEKATTPPGWLIWSLHDGGCGVVYRRDDGKMIINAGMQGDFCYI